MSFLPRDFPQSLEKEAEAVHAWAREFTETVLIPRASEIDQAVWNDSAKIPLDWIEKANDYGLFDAWLPRAYGGRGYSPWSYMIASQVWAEACLGFTNIMGAHYFAITLLSCGMEMPLLEKVCRRIVDGRKNRRPYVLAGAITEPDAGSDLEDTDLIQLARIRTKITLQPDTAVIRGGKTFISNAKWASAFVVAAYEDLKRPHQTAAIAWIEANQPGVTVGKVEAKLGQSACPASEVRFDGVEIPLSQLALYSGLFSNHQDYLDYCELLLDEVLGNSRLGVSVMAAGVSRAIRAAVEKQASDWREEWKFARLGEILKNDEILRLLANEANLRQWRNGPQAETQNGAGLWLVQNLPAVVLRALFNQMPPEKLRLKKLQAWRKEAKREKTIYWGSLFKAGMTDLLMDSLHHARALIGADVWKPNALPIEKWTRDAKLLQIYEGTNALNVVHVAKAIGALGSRKLYELE